MWNLFPNLIVDLFPNLIVDLFARLLFLAGGWCANVRWEMGWPHRLRFVDRYRVRRLWYGLSSPDTRLQPKRRRFVGRDV